jgi:hypothetical protein
MSMHPLRHNAPIHDELHPIVYRTMVGLTVWLVASMLLLFNRGPYVGLNLLVICFFFLIFVGVPVLLAVTWRRNRGEDVRSADPQKFREWAACEFSTWTGGLSGREAALQILLPLAAVAIGMTIFGLVFLFDVPQML